MDPDSEMLRFQGDRKSDWSEVQTTLYIRCSTIYVWSTRTVYLMLYYLCMKYSYCISDVILFISAGNHLQVLKSTITGLVSINQQC